MDGLPWARHRSRLDRVPAWLLLAGMVAVSTVIRSIAARGVGSPWIAPDEIIYALLGRALYESGDLSILGAETGFYSLLYPALVGLPLSIADAETGHRVLHVVQALVVSCTADSCLSVGTRPSRKGRSARRGGADAGPSHSRLLGARDERGALPPRRDARALVSGPGARAADGGSTGAARPCRDGGARHAAAGCGADPGRRDRRPREGGARSRSARRPALRGRPRSGPDRDPGGGARCGLWGIRRLLVGGRGLVRPRRRRSFRGLSRSGRRADLGSRAFPRAGFALEHEHRVARDAARVARIRRGHAGLHPMARTRGGNLRVARGRPPRRPRSRHGGAADAARVRRLARPRRAEAPAPDCDHRARDRCGAARPADPPARHHRDDPRQLRADSPGAAGARESRARFRAGRGRRDRALHAAPAAGDHASRPNRLPLSRRRVDDCGAGGGSAVRASRDGPPRQPADLGRRRRTRRCRLPLRGRTALDDGLAAPVLEPLDRRRVDAGPAAPCQALCRRPRSSLAPTGDWHPRRARSPRRR